MMTKEEFLKQYGTDNEFMCKLLGRMDSDCKYYIGCCACSKASRKYLWAVGDPNAHIQYMKWLYETLLERGWKPDWITMKDIREYEKRMRCDN